MGNLTSTAPFCTAPQPYFDVMPILPSTDPRDKKRNGGLVVLTLIVVVAILHFAQEVLMPFAVAVVLSFVLAPLVVRLQGWGLNRVISVMMTAILAFALLGGLVYVVANEFLGLVEELPRYKQNLREKIHVLRSPLGADLRRGTDTVKELTEELKKAAAGAGDPPSPRIAKVQIVEPAPGPIQVVQALFSPVLKPLGTAALIIVLVIFMLLEREDLRNRLIRLLGAKEIHTTTLALDDAAGRVSRFLLVQLLINAIHGFLVAIGLYALGVPNAVLWGALSLVLRFIPYLGAWLAAAMPVAVSVAVFGNWTDPLMTVGLFLVLELISNNILEPWLYGKRTGVSPFALIVAAMFWTWLWGISGLFLAIPLTVCLVVLGKYIPQLEFLGVLLGDQPVLAPHERFYQRLLASDPEEAEDLIEEALKEKSLLEVCDTVVVPAMQLAEQDDERGVLEETRRHYIFEYIAQLVEDLCEAQEAQATPARHAPITVLCLPASDQADEVAARMFARLLQLSGIEAHHDSIDAVRTGTMDRLDRLKPDLVFVCALPPGAVMPARYICKRVRSGFKDLPILVGLWNALGDTDKARQRLKSAGAGKVVTTFAGGIDVIRQLASSVDLPIPQEAVEAYAGV